MDAPVDRQVAVEVVAPLLSITEGVGAGAAPALSDNQKTICVVRALVALGVTFVL